MRITLKSLEKKIDDEKWSYMIVNAHNKTFKPVYSSDKPFTPSVIKAIYSENVSKFANQSMAYITIICLPDMIEDGAVAIGLPWVLAVKINIRKLNDKAQEQVGVVNNWGLGVNIMPEELEQKPFTLEFVKSLVKLTKDKLITSSATGLNGITGLNNTIKRKKEALIAGKKKKHSSLIPVFTPSFKSPMMDQPI